MNRVRKAACILLLVTTPMLATAAQNVPAMKPSTEQSASEKAQPRNPLLQKITSLLDQVLEEQKSFPDETLRVMLQALVADMLWSYDAPRARRLFEDILQVSERLADQSASAPQVGGVSPYPAHTEVIRMIMPHDSDWATRLVESRGELASDLKSRSIGKNRQRTGLQLQLGFFFARQDPQRAVLAAKPFAENGDLNSLMTLWGMIRFKDAKAAEDLLIQALTKAKLGQPSFEDIRAVAFNVFPSFGEGVLRFSPDASKRDPLAPANSGPAAVEQFLDLAYDVTTRRLDAALTGTDVARLDARSMLDYTIPKLLTPYFDRFMPDRAPAFRARVQEALRRVPAQERQYLVLTESGTIEELLSRADAIAEPRLKDTLIQRAVLQVSNSGDFEQAAAIIERLSNEGGRSNARNTLRQRVDQKHSDEAWSALNQSDFDKAEMLAAEPSDWRSDGLLVTSLIGHLSRKDKPRATRILDEYERRAAGIQETNERALRLMQLAGVAANIDVNRGFEEMKRAIVEFNHADFAPEMERYRDNERWGGNGSPAQRVNIGLGEVLNRWNLQWLGRADFDRAVALTQQLQMREAAALMQLSVCRGAMANLPAPAR